MDQTYVTSLASNPQRLPTPVPVEEVPSKQVQAAIGRYRLVPVQSRFRILSLPDELKMEIMKYLVEPRKVHRRVVIQQGAYRNRIMMLRATHYRNTSGLYLNEDFTAMLNARYYARALFTFEFAHIQGNTPTFPMPWHRAAVQSPLKCLESDLCNKQISHMRKMCLTFTIWSSFYTPANILASNHIAMINIAHAVDAVTAFGLYSRILTHLKVKIRVHQRMLLEGTADVDDEGGLDTVIENLKQCFLLHCGNRRMWRRNIANLNVEYV